MFSYLIPDCRSMIVEEDRKNIGQNIRSISPCLCKINQNLFRKLIFLNFLKFGLFTIITNHKILCCAGVTARLLFMRAHLYVYLSTLDGVTELRKVLWKSGKTCLSSKIFYRAFVEDQIKILIFQLSRKKLSR